MGHLKADDGRYERASREKSSVSRENLNLISPTNWVGADLTNSEAEQCLAAIQESLSESNIALELPVLERDRFRQILSDNLQNIDGDDFSPTAALSQTATQWRTVINEIGATEF